MIGDTISRINSTTRGAWKCDFNAPGRKFSLKRPIADRDFLPFSARARELQLHNDKERRFDYHGCIGQISTCGNVDTVILSSVDTILIDTGTLCGRKLIMFLLSSLLFITNNA